EVRAEDRTQPRSLEPPPGLPAGTAQLEPPLREWRGGGKVRGGAAENHQPSAAVEPPPAVLGRDDRVEDLEAQVLALHAVIDPVVEEELVAQVTALVIEAQSSRPAPTAQRHLRPDEVVGVEKVPRTGVEVELREDRAEQAHLDPVAPAGLPQTPDAERAPEGDHGHVDVGALPLGEHVGAAAEMDAPVVRVESRLALVREQRAEDVVVGQENAFQRARRFHRRRLRLRTRPEEQRPELQYPTDLVCRLLLEK